MRDVLRKLADSRKTLFNMARLKAGGDFPYYIETRLPFDLRIAFWGISETVYKELKSI